MNDLKNYFLLALIVLSVKISAQQNNNYNIWNPSKGVYALEGQFWHGDQVKNFYDPLPAKAQNTVRQPVWNLSKNTAGISLRFTSNAKEIIVRYQVSGAVQMPHFAATGVSGVDLFAVKPASHPPSSLLLIF